MERPQRILFLADINSVHTERWVRLLTEQGLSLAVFSLSAKNTDWIDGLEVPYRSFGAGATVTRSQGDRKKLQYFRAAKEVRVFQQEFKPDIVHAHYATSYGMLAMRLRFPKTVLSLWGTDVFEFPRKSILHRTLFKRIVRKASVVCSTSHAMAQEATKYVQRDYVITPFGTDMERFVPAEKSVGDVLRVGTVKSLESVYGIDRLLQVFSVFREQSDASVELHIYGSGSQEGALKQLAKNLGVSNETFFHGFVQGDALVEAFQSLDVALFLSRSESFGVAALEAQACGVPSIVSNVGGLPEVCAHKDFVVDGENIGQIVDLVASLQNKKERKSRGVQAREFVRSNYSEAACVKKYMDVYNQL